MSSFTARTRLRGEVTYHPAKWIDDYRNRGSHIVIFLKGKHKGEKHLEHNCAIAKDDKYLLGEKNDA